MVWYGMVLYGFSYDNMATIVRVYSAHPNSTLTRAVGNGDWDGWYG